MSSHQYYEKYISDGDETSDDNESSDSESTDTAARGLDDPRYAIIRSAGQNLGGTGTTYQVGNLSNIGTPYEIQPQDTLKNSLLYKSPQKRIQTTLFSFKSSNRDKRVYPTTSDFSIKLPRPYKDVTQIQLVQISYQSFFNYIPDVLDFANKVVPVVKAQGIDISECLCCIPRENTQGSIAVVEVGRADPLYPSKPLVQIVTVRYGRYTNTTLATEMINQMNDTPVFNIISYTEHRRRFKGQRTLYHLFNIPGDIVYNRITDTYDTIYNTSTDPAKIYGPIYLQYFPESFLQQSTLPTETEIFVAYYFPVLKEAMYDTEVGAPFLDLAGDSYNAAYIKIVSVFEGLDSKYYYDLCVLNLPFLIKYRQTLTFTYNLIYKYVWSYDAGMQRFTVTHNVLHKSITNDIAAKTTEFQQTAYDKFVVTADDVAAAEVSVDINKSVYTELESTVYSALAEVGVTYGLYPSGLLTNSATVVTTANPTTINPELLTENDTLLYMIAQNLIVPPNNGGYIGPPVNGLGLNTFGNISLADLVNQSNEIYLNINTIAYDPTYLSYIQALNTTSTYDRRIGGDYLNGFSGIVLQSNSFSDLYAQYTLYYSLYINDSSLLTNIANYRTQLMDTYMNDKYGTVLPSGLIAQYTAMVETPAGSTDTSGNFISENNNLGDNGTGAVILHLNNGIIRGSSPFQVAGCNTNNACCKIIDDILLTWYCKLPPNYVITTLPWRLGLTETLENVVTRITTNTAFAKTSPFNVYIQLNVERSMNNMAVAANENYSITNEPVSETKVVLGKLLTEGTGISDVVQSIIQSPAQFYIPIGKLDKLQFTLLLDDLVPLSALFPISLEFTDWSATVQIDEEIRTLDREVDLSNVPTIEWDEKKRPF